MQGEIQTVSVEHSSDHYEREFTFKGPGMTEFVDVGVKANYEGFSKIVLSPEGNVKSLPVRGEGLFEAADGTIVKKKDEVVQFDDQGYVVK